MNLKLKIFKRKIYNSFKELEKESKLRILLEG